MFIYLYEVSVSQNVSLQTCQLQREERQVITGKKCAFVVREKDNHWIVDSGEWRVVFSFMCDLTHRRRNPKKKRVLAL